MLFGLYLLAALACNAWITSGMLDYRKLDEDLLELSWQLQLPWRASHSEWVARDFPYTLGPLFQLLGWIGAGFDFWSAGRTMAGYLVAFVSLSLAIAAWLAFEVVRDPWRRFLTFACLTIFVIWSEGAAVRAVLLLVVILLYGPRPDGDEDSAPPWRAVAAAGALTIAMLFSYDRGVVGIVAVTAMATYEVVGRRVIGRPLRVAVRRYLLFIGALAGCQLAVAVIAAVFFVDYAAYLLGQASLAGSFALGMANPGDEGTLNGAIALCLCAAALALWLLHRRIADLVAGAWLVGTLPTLVVALVRTDPPHVWAAMVPVAITLVLVTARQIERRRVAFPIVAGVLSALVVFGWLGSHAERLRPWSPEVFVDAVSFARGDMAPEDEYESNITRVLAFVRERRAEEGIECVGAYQGGDVVHALADIPGPTRTLLRWSSDLQRDVARRIETDRCPYYVQRLFSYDWQEGGAWNVGEDFLAVARLYEPHQRLGPDVWALSLRDQPTPELVRRVDAEGLGERRVLSVPGSVELELEPMRAEHLVRLTYTLEVGWWRPYVGGVPMMYVDFLSEDGEQLSHLYLPPGAINRRVEAITALHAEAAERRWMTGREPRDRLSAGGIRISAMPESDTTPGEIALTIHDIEELIPGGAPIEDRGECDGASNLMDSMLGGRAFARATALTFEHDGLHLHPNPPLYAQAEVFVPVRACPRTCLAGRFAIDPAPESDGDGVRFEVHVIDREIRTLVVDQALGPSGEPFDFELSLGPWADRSVLVRVGVEPRESPDYDWSRIERLELVPCASAELAAELQRGRGSAEHAEPSVTGRDIFLHPNGAGDPPARVSIPVRPGPGSCLITDLRVSSEPGQGDGVTFVAEIVDGAVEHPLFSQLVPAGTDSGPHRASLDPWAGRAVHIRLSTLSGPSADYDWAHFIGPRIGRCDE